MSTYVGGLRARLVRQAFYNLLHGELQAIGWFNSGRRHTPINMIAAPSDPENPVPKNTLAIGDGPESSIDQEVGSILAQHRWTFWVDFFAEDDTVGLHLAEDVRDIIGGRFTSITGRYGPTLPVYDYMQATPPLIFTCLFENVVLDRANNFPEVWRQHWYAVRCEVVDYYGSDED